eukprot:TRINITY_DN18084_c0_g1_i2.p1 TRINITY_DN18084_c0_g1~~TRINITY_DN18084_c0_g1_i2.p1  ORF type:complete len:234 (-),score=59.94 TRINITY_DN18084_c0_g1_i2:169-870(-)
MEKLCLEIARQHVVDAAKKATERRVKRIKCKGCGAIVADNDAFAAHCGEVEHDDDFAYECDEVEVVIQSDESLPEGTIDISDAAKVHSFYSTDKEPFAHSYAATVELNGVTYRTLEHYWLCAPFLGRSADLVARIQAAPTPGDAAAVAFEGSHEAQSDPDFHDKRAAVLLEAVHAKFSQHSELAKLLLATGDKMIVLVDTDPWAGMQAPGGIATGQNNVGKALMEVRAKLKAA